MSTRKRPLAERFLEKIEKVPSGCWEWKGGRCGAYGIFWKEGVRRKAHRVAYELFKTSIPDGLLVRHTCDNPVCVNPAHLVLGTDADNAQDRCARGRTAQGPSHGRAVLSTEDVRTIRQSRGRSGALAATYGVSKRHVQMIRAGQTRRSM